MADDRINNFIGQYIDLPSTKCVALKMNNYSPTKHTNRSRLQKVYFHSSHPSTRVLDPIDRSEHINMCMRERERVRENPRRGLRAVILGFISFHWAAMRKCCIIK